MNKTINTLEKLVSYPTISSSPVVELGAYLAQLAEDNNFEVIQFATSPTKVNVVAHIGPWTKTSLALCGHMDVVPTDGQNWTSDPFRLTQREDRLYGRGSCDMKGFIAASMAAISELNLRNLTDGLTLIWTHDEEVGCLGAQALQQQLQFANLSLPKAVLIGEPTSLDICRMNGGHTTVEISIKGVPAHSSKPLLGNSAILAAVSVIQQINSLQSTLQAEPCSHHEMRGACSLINVAQIEGGEAINIVPEKCKIQLGIRPMPGHDIHTIISEIQHQIKFVSEKTQCDIQISIPQNAPPLLTPKNTDLEKLLRKKRPQAKSIGVPFATDGGSLAELDTTPIICGPGSIDVAHKPDEYVPIAELMSCQQMVSSLIYDWCLS